MHPLPIFKKWMFYPLIILVVLSIATPVLADYLGPNRTVTETTGSCQVVLYECQYVAAKGDYREKRVEDWSCSNESKPWQAYPGNAPACNAANNGRVHWEREEDLQDVTVTYPPATISSSLQNCSPQNGWCTTIPQLLLSGDEPVAGFGIYAIEGSLNGQQFSCMNSSCSVSLNQGSNNVAYWALSSFGDTSTMGTLNANVDSDPPNVTGSFTGTQGSNGWYTGPVSFNGSASDAVSGLASFTCSLDSVALGSCNPFTITSDGLHSLVVTARDNAGHTRTLTQSASIDTRNPVLNALISGTLGSNNWFTAATLSASAADPSPGSGLSSFEYSIDRSAWIAFPVSGTVELADGKHGVDLRALDNAGHLVFSSRSFWLDTVAPGITLESAGTTGLNGWYTTSPTLTASANDSTSGLDVFEYSLDNAAWQLYTTSLTLNDGVHRLSLWAQDAAGLVTQVDRTYQVDTRVPQIAGSLSGTSGANGWYISDVILSASASDPVPGSGMDSFTYLLDGRPAAPFSNPLPLSDGQHSVQFHATDKAGLTYSMEQEIKVDTKQPSLKIDTTPPAWVRDHISLRGTAADDGSGLSKVEISLDGGQTWQAAVGTDSWIYNWDTLNSSNGNHQVNVRIVDRAGLSMQQSLRVGIDNRAPEIRLPDSWFQWDTVTLDIWDNHSGLSEARVEILDPEGRWPKRVIELNPQHFPLSFKWDRRFGNGIVAPLGIYEMKVFASDGLENTSTEKASIKILLDALPAGPTSTPQAYIRAEPTTTPVYAAAPVASPQVTQPAVVSVFGVIEPTVQSTPAVGDSPVTRAAPTQTGVLDWLQSIFVPARNEERITGFEAPEEPTNVPQAGATESIPVLWGAAAAAAIGAATASALEERRRRDEELVRQAEQEMERDAQTRARKLEKQQENWLKQQILAWDTYTPHMDYKMQRKDWEDENAWLRTQAVLQYREEAAARWNALMAQQAAYSVALLKKEREEPKPEPKSEVKTEPNWWDKAKTSVNENIVQPFNTHVYEPLVKPAVDFLNEAEAKFNSRFDEAVRQPYIQPVIERSVESSKRELAWIDAHIQKPILRPIGQALSQGLSNGINWANEKVYQPHIKPALEWAGRDLAYGVEWVDRNFYQPFLQPVVTLFDEKIYQPAIQPIVENVLNAVHDVNDWVNDEIYYPYIEPIERDIKEYIIQPLVRKGSEWWGQYGEWVHGALDAVGFIPGVGEVADGINGVLYVAEGNYVAASLSLMSMIPLVGDMSKVGKWGLKAGQDAIDNVVGTAYKAFGGDLTEKLAQKSLLEEGAEKAAKEIGQPLITDDVVERVVECSGFIPGAGMVSTTATGLIQLGRGKFIDATLTAASMIPVVGDFATFGKNIVDSSLNRLLVKEATEQTIKKTARELVETGAATIVREVKEDVIREVGEESVEKVTRETLEESAEKLSKETVEAQATKTTKEIFTEAVTRVKKEMKEDALVDKVTETETNTVPTRTVEEPILVKTKEKSHSNEQTETNAHLQKKHQDLIDKHGQIAIDALGGLDPSHANKLLKTLDPDVLDYAIQQGPDAVNALSRWDEHDLQEHGPKLALRAKKDAQALAAVEKLVSSGPIDPDNLTSEQQALIKEIAEYSTQYPDGLQIVLGKWVDNGNGFVEYAQDTGSAHYNPHTEMWNMLGSLGEENQAKVAWLINREVVKTGVDKGMAFEYSLSGVPAEDIDNEHAAIEAVFSGKSNEEIASKLEKREIPIRMKELQELQKAGYGLTFDELTDSYILIKPQKGLSL
jgi:hypothetical protein